MQSSDLQKHQPEKYRVPTKEALNSLDEGDFIKISYIDSEDIW